MPTDTALLEYARLYREVEIRVKREQLGLVFMENAMREMTLLYAERDDEEYDVAEGLTMDEARDLVLDMENKVGVNPGEYNTNAEKIEAGIWPEGFDAVFVDTDELSYMLVDNWEPYDK